MQRLQVAQINPQVQWLDEMGDPVLSCDVPGQVVLLAGSSPPGGDAGILTSCTLTLYSPLENQSPSISREKGKGREEKQSTS